MKPEIPPSSYDPDEIGQLPPEEAIMVLIQDKIQVLNQLDIISMHLLHALEEQVEEVEALGSRMKELRKIPKSIKKAYNEQYWWVGLAEDIKMYQEQFVDCRTRLITFTLEACGEKKVAFKQLQEDIDTLYPQ